MANTSKSRSSGSSRGSSKKSSSSKTTRSNTSRKTTAKSKPVPQESGSGFSDLFGKFASSKAAAPLIFIGAVLLIVGIDLLVSWNKFEMFFKILGVEILIAVVVWGIMTLVFSRKGSKDPEGEV